jgi:hypothetical protein
MWTFTKRGKFATRDDVWAAWREFCRLVDVRRLHSVEGLPWVYAAVPELHSDGDTFHLHVAVRGLFEVTTLRFLWLRALGGRGDERGSESLGNVHAKHFKRRRGQKQARAISSYISVYVGKGMSGGAADRKSFATSKDLQPLEVQVWSHRYASDPEDTFRLMEACGELVRQLGWAEAWPRARSFGARSVAWFESG